MLMIIIMRIIHILKHYQYTSIRIRISSSECCTHQFLMGMSSSSVLSPSIIGMAAVPILWYLNLVVSTRRTADVDSLDHVHVTHTHRRFSLRQSVSPSGASLSDLTAPTQACHHPTCSTPHPICARASLPPLWPLKRAARSSSRAGSRASSRR